VTIDYAAIEARRAEIRQRYVLPRRPSSSARGLHHIALLSSNVERTIQFYQDLLEFPLTEIIENRDYKGSNHFFFDIGNGNLLAFFDFPGLDLGPYQEVLGGLHHIAISVDPATWERLRGKRAAPPFTSRTPTAPGWSCSPTISVRCTARGCCDLTSRRPPRARLAGTRLLSDARMPFCSLGFLLLYGQTQHEQ
jgi:catechol 2,3-dioxygenase-like lactoylglutathione lyase family enzyme